MKLIHRIGYYLGGFSIGLILLAFFLGGKKTSCAYGPNARTIKNISIKKREYSAAAMSTMASYQIDTLDISRLIESQLIIIRKLSAKRIPILSFPLSEIDGFSYSSYSASL